MTEVMSHAVVKTRTMKPLPGEITTQRINDATLPVKIEAARRAIAECEDLPELLRYRDQAEGLAAAVRIMKHVAPEMVRSANEMVADAWRKGGELLSAYSGAAQSPKRGVFSNTGTTKSPRRKMADSLGLSDADARSMVRVAAAPAARVYSAVSQSKSLHAVAEKLPVVQRQNKPGMRAYSETLRLVMSKLTTMSSAGAHIPLESLKHLQPDERKVVKAKITEIMELLDEMDRLCK